MKFCLPPRLRLPRWPRPVPPAARRRGVALLLTLGLLSLILVMAIAFATMAAAAQRNSRFTESIAHARQYCDSALQRLVAAFKTQWSDFHDFSTFFPGTRNFVAGSGAWAGYYYFISALDPADVVDDGLAEALRYRVNGLDCHPAALPNGVPASWQPVFQTEMRYGQPVSVLAGRFAYLALDESGKLDPTACVSSTYAEGSEPLLGQTMHEANLLATWLPASLVTKLRPVAAGGRMPANAVWYGMDHIIRATGASQGEVDAMAPLLLPNVRADTIEATSSHFDLLGNSLSVNDLVTNIPWLRNWVLAGNYSSAAARAKQLAANLLDYNDADYDSTTDHANNPTYFGVEKVPYLARVQVRLINASTNGHNGKTQPTLRVYARPELINFHGDLSGYTNTAFVRLTISVTWKNALMQSTTQEVTIERTLTQGAADTTGTFAANGYLRSVTLGDYQESSGPIIDTPNQFAIHEAQARLVRADVRRVDRGDRWDWASTDLSPATELLGVNDFALAHFAAYNPVNNFNPGDWTSTVDVVDRFAAPFTDPAADCPEWWALYPLFVRNGPMQHLVELGAIYRMEPYDAADVTKSFRTFNLVDYKYSGDPQTPGDYAEADDTIIDNLDGTLIVGEGNGGDRNLLDMVRLGNADTAEKSLVGRININTRHPEVLRALFRRIPNETFTGNVAIDSTKVDTLITNILAYTRSKPLPLGLLSGNRNPAFYGLLFQDSQTDLPQSAREYLLVLTKELVSAEHNFFSVIIAGQTIQDVGAIAPDEMTLNGVPAQLGRYDLGADRILATQRVRVILYRNAYTNRITVESYDYLDD